MCTEIIILSKLFAWMLKMVVDNIEDTQIYMWYVS